MGKGTCAYDGCTSDVRARGWCSLHYQRWRNHGDPGIDKRRLYNSPRELFEAYSWRPSDAACHTWTGALTDGYGVMTVWGDRTYRVHTWLWTQTYGPIPPGMVLDHECHNEAAFRGECAGGPGCAHRACHNLEHLRLTTRAGNLAASPIWNGNKTHCVHGHEFTDANTYWHQGIHRCCRECGRIRAAARRLSQRGEA